MTINGSLTPQFWQALFQAQERGQQNQNGYTYAIASKRTAGDAHHLAQRPLS